MTLLRIAVGLYFGIAAVGGLHHLWERVTNPLLALTIDVAVIAVVVWAALIWRMS